MATSNSEKEFVIHVQINEEYLYYFKKIVQHKRKAIKLKQTLHTEKKNTMNQLDFIH